MTRFYRLIFALSRLAAFMAAVAMVCMVGIIALEIILRGLFSTSTFVTAEFVGYGIRLCYFRSGHLWWYGIGRYQHV